MSQHPAQAFHPLALSLAHYGKTCPVIGQGIEPSSTMSKNTIANGQGQCALRHTLSVSYWDGQDIIETFATGATKKETISNWFIQRYGGTIPNGACLPHERDLISIKWGKVKQ